MWWERSAMFLKKILIKDYAEPWNTKKTKQQLNIYPEDTTIDQLHDFEVGKDFALQDKNGNMIAWIPYQRLIEEIFLLYKESIAYYEALLLSVNDAVTGINEKDEIVTWNQASERFYGYPLTKVLNKPITDFFHEEAVVVKQVIKNKESIEKKYNQPAPNAHVLINATPVYLDGKVIGGISVERDISDLVRLNEELSNTKAYIHDLENKYEKSKLEDPFGKIKGKSRVIRDTITIAKKVTKTDATILITGESGVGKELFAEAIHNGSNRVEKPFVAINCGAIPASLFESELFGYEKGTFTGANKEGKKGKIDLAQGGSLFLDEIGELPLDLQVKLLRVLQEKSFYRLGGEIPIPIDVRIITATNRNLEAMIDNGAFREDLFYRLNVITLNIPSLRERPEDIPDLLSLFLKEFSLKYSTSIPKISSDAMSVLLQEEWRGNIRQLRNVAERLIILSGEEEIIERHQLPSMFNKGKIKIQEEGISKKSHAMNEEEAIREALLTTYHNKSAAAKLLGMSRATLYNKMKIHGIS